MPTERRSSLNKMIDEKYIAEVVRWDMGHSISALWDWSRKYPPFKGDLSLSKKGFFYLVEHFMREGILKLGHQGEFLPGSIEEQLQYFEASWPADYDENVEEKDIDNLWWLLFAPAGAVWIYPDGHEVWT